MLRKIGLALVAAGVLWLGIRALVRALASDATRIRWNIEDACEGFSDARMAPILDVLARDFVDDTAGARRDDVRTGAAYEFFTEKDPRTRQFPLRAELVPGSLLVDVKDGSPRTAQARFTIRVTDTRGGGARTVWEFRVTGSMIDGDEGWQLTRSTHQDLAGDSGMH